MEYTTYIRFYSLDPAYKPKDLVLFRFPNKGRLLDVADPTFLALQIFYCELELYLFMTERMSRLLLLLAGVSYKTFPRVTCRIKSLQIQHR